MNVLKKIKNVPGLYRLKNTGVYYERIQTPTANTFESLSTTNQDAAKGHLIVRKAARAAVADWLPRILSLGVWESATSC